MAESESTPKGKKAVLLGGTGLVGRELINQLLQEDSYRDITLLTRRSVNLRDSRLHEELIDFQNPQSWSNLVHGDVLFSSLGTTIKVAGSQEAQFQVDHDFQLWAAQAAAKNGIQTYVLVSSTGASAKARLFYPRMKGQLEEAVTGLGFFSCNLLRPSILDGNRVEARRGERFALNVLSKLPKWTLPPSARPTKVTAVARSCVVAAQQAQEGVRIIEAREIERIASTPAS